MQKAMRINDERGFTMIEVLIVSVILLTLAAIAVPTFFGARKSASRGEIIDAAHGYATAIEAFRLDHAGKPPVFNSADWPSGENASRGPVNSLYKNVPSKYYYLRSGAPSIVTKGGATLGTDTSSSIQYLRDPAIGSNMYAFIVTYDKKSCFIGTPFGQVEQQRLKAC